MYVCLMSHESAERKLYHCFFFFHISHIILHISTWNTFLHVEIGKIMWRHVEFGKIMWRNVDKKTTVKVSRIFAIFWFFQEFPGNTYFPEYSGIYLIYSNERSALDLFDQAECSCYFLFTWYIDLYLVCVFKSSLSTIYHCGNLVFPGTFCSYYCRLWVLACKTPW